MFLDNPIVNEEEKEKLNKFKALEDLDVLGDLLKKENMQRSGPGNFSKYAFLLNWKLNNPPLFQKWCSRENTNETTQ